MSDLINNMLSYDALGAIGEVGETVTYVAADGTETVLKAVVDRGAPKEMRESSYGGLYNEFTVELLNDASAGVTRVEVSRDAIKLSEREGDAATARTITQIIDHDAGTWRVLCR